MANNSGNPFADLSAQSQLPRPEPPRSSAAVPVEIYDQIYNLRGTDPVYIERLAQIVDGKMRAVSAGGGTVDSLRVAVLAALNIADELESLRQRYEQLAGSMSQSQRNLRSRAGSLAHMLDEVLTDSPAREQVREDVRKVG